MVLSRACKYGLQAMLYLASQPAGRPVLVRDVAQSLDVPFPFLAKVIQALSRRHLIQSYKGRGGGVTLARPSCQITFLEVVKAIDGLDCTEACILAMPECLGSQPCSLHEDWDDLRGRLHEMLRSRTIGAFAEELGDRRHALKRS